MIDNWYILDGRKVIRCADMMEWIRWFEKAEGKDGRRIALTEKMRPFWWLTFWRRPYTITVSTVFLGVDHSFGGGKPILFETMVFGSCAHDEACERYSTYEEAERGHRDMCRKVFGQEE